MTEKLKRDVNASMDSMKSMHRELSQTRRLLADVYHLLRTAAVTDCNVKVSREAIEDYLRDRGLL